MYISAIVQTQDGTIFVGTGEGAPFSEPFNVGGRGVYYKNPNDPNDVWTLVPGTANLDVNELAAAPVNNKVFIGTTSGLRMLDKNAGGNDHQLALVLAAVMRLKFQAMVWCCWLVLEPINLAADLFLKMEETLGKQCTVVLLMEKYQQVQVDV